MKKEMTENPCIARCKVCGQVFWDLYEDGVCPMTPHHDKPGSRFLNGFGRPVKQMPNSVKIMVISALVVIVILLATLVKS
jgi:hypothetical protein